MNWTDLDNWIVITGIFSALSCAILGNFMVLRRLSMMGDAISHAVLPGLAAAFLLSGSRDSITMFAGAAVVGILTAIFTDIIHRLGKVEESASMGVVFTTLFALGLIMIVKGADAVDLDPGCVLYGAIELVPLDTKTVFGIPVPRAVIALATVLIINLLFVIIFYKELKISSFDPDLATTVGANALWMHFMLMTLVAITTVASFESVGSILVIAMLIVPAATAYLITEQLRTMIIVSLLIAELSAILGHCGALTLPRLWGFSDTSTAGMIAVASGAIFFLTLFLSPKHGIVFKSIKRFWTFLKISREDILGLLYRLSELKFPNDVRFDSNLFSKVTGSGAFMYHAAILSLKLERKVIAEKNDYKLTNLGKKSAASLIRSHRLWESYLYKYLNIPIDHLHFSAERFEHVTDAKMQEQLSLGTESPTQDPHGKNIPE